MPLSMCFEFYFESQSTLKALKVIVLLLQGVTCVVLTVAVLKIRKIVNDIKGIDIKIGRLVLHLAAFWLYFISYFIYYVSYIQNDTRHGFWFEFALLATVVTETISVIILTYIIWEIYSISLEQQMMDEEYERVQS
jgi:hypothetical protein